MLGCRVGPHAFLGYTHTTMVLTAQDSLSIPLSRRLETIAENTGGDKVYNIHMNLHSAFQLFFEGILLPHRIRSEVDESGLIIAEVELFRATRRINISENSNSDIIYRNISGEIIGTY